MKHLLPISLLIVVSLGFEGCNSSEKIMDDSQPQQESAADKIPLATLFDTSQVFNKNFTGFVLHDPETDSTLYSQFEDKYFTPASNTKLFTFYAGLKVLPDTLTALEYVIKGDSLIFWGTGDPTFLHPDFEQHGVYDFLKDRQENLYYSDSHFDDDVLGPGWAWGDYQYYYSTERTPFPIYGNVVRFTIEDIRTRRIKLRDDGAEIPRAIQKRIVTSADTGDVPLVYRDFNDNTFEYKIQSDTLTSTTDRPFHYTPDFFTELLSDTLGRPVEYLQMNKPAHTQKLYSTSLDTVYKRLLHPSDNFVAEQLLFAMASELGKPMNSRSIINYIKANYMDDFVDEPVWRDGSGLSRYNLFTPRTIVQLLTKIDNEFEDDEEMFSYFPAGGRYGTIRSWYASREGGAPYVFAKTGTLSNNHCLSGFLITESGKKLIFSFMNNHYTSYSSEVKTEMEKVLWYIHKNF